MILGINIDHIAVLREARKSGFPNLIDALSLVERGGGEQITIHLREDRRHIIDRDLEDIVKFSVLPVNLELSINDEIVDLALKIRPHRATIVPEKRNEVTTEGGLNLKDNFWAIKSKIDILKDNDIEVSLFIDPNVESINLSRALNVDWVELHTGTFSNIFAMLNSNLSRTAYSIKDLENLSKKELEQKLDRASMDLEESAILGNSLELKVAGGHGLNYQNIKLFNKIAKNSNIREVNIGQSIVARSIFVGLENAVREMRNLVI
jgi:pyridoxine 5-phosphate synthase